MCINFILSTYTIWLQYNGQRTHSIDISLHNDRDNLNPPDIKTIFLFKNFYQIFPNYVLNISIAYYFFSKMVRAYRGIYGLGTYIRW